MRTALAAIAALTIAVAAPAFAWKGALASGVRTIAEVKEKAESGDFVIVEGTITEVSTGSGSRLIVMLEDATGTLPVRVPEHLLRSLNDGKPPQVGRHVRVGGEWTHAYLDQDTWGIHAQTAERVE